MLIVGVKIFGWRAGVGAKSHVYVDGVAHNGAARVCGFGLEVDLDKLRPETAEDKRCTACWRVFSALDLQEERQGDGRQEGQRAGAEGAEHGQDDGGHG